MNAKKEKLRAPVQWFGGKGAMTAKLMPLVPEGGQPYCEPYMGAACLFFARDPAPVEVLNDLDGDLVNLFRCLQDKDSFEELRHRLMWTPYARAEFARALDVLDDPNAPAVDRAWAFFVAKNQGFAGMTARTVGNWSRTFTQRSGMAGKTSKWLMRLSMLDAWRWRLMRAQIDSRDAIEVIRYWDCTDAVFYIDPPYHHDTRKDVAVYAVEPDHDHHARLVQTLLSLQGRAVLSGYAHPVYAPLEAAGWRRIDFETACHAAGRGRGSGLQGKGAALAKVARVESVWINPAAQAAIDRLAA